MATWSRSRLASLRQRISSLTVHATIGNVPIEAGGPFVTELDIQNAGQGIEEILTTYRTGTATEAQLRAIWAVNDANAEAAEQREREAALDTEGYQTGYGRPVAEYDLGPQT